MSAGLAHWLAMALVQHPKYVFILLLAIGNSIGKPSYAGSVTISISQSRLPGTRLKVNVDETSHKTKLGSSLGEAHGEGDLKAADKERTSSGEEEGSIDGDDIHRMSKESLEKTTKYTSYSGSGSAVEESSGSDKLQESEKKNKDGQIISSVEKSLDGSGDPKAKVDDESNDSSGEVDNDGESSHGFDWTYLMESLADNVGYVAIGSTAGKISGKFDEYIDAKSGNVVNVTFKGSSNGDGQEEESSYAVPEGKDDIASKDLPTGTRASKESNSKGYRLPILDDFMETRSKLREKYVHEGCDITVSSDWCKINLDFDSKKCKDVMSLPRLYEYLTKSSLDEFKKFVQLDKFNVDEVNLDVCQRLVSFDTLAKEPFEMIHGSGIQVHSGTLQMEFKYERQSFPTFKSTIFDISGQIKIANISTYFSLTKAQTSTEGRYSFDLSAIKLSDYYSIFSKTKELDQNTLANMSKLVDVNISSARVTGSRNLQGDVELIFTSGLQNISGIGPGKAHVIVHKQVGKCAAVGVVVEVKHIKAANALKYLTGLTLPNVPIINHQRLEMIIEYSNSDIKAYRSEEINDLFNQFVTPVSIKKGTKLKMVIPLKKMIDKDGLTFGTNMNTYVDIVIRKSNISFFIPEHTVLDLIRILTLFIPEFKPREFEAVIADRVDIRIVHFEVDVRTKEIYIEIDSVDGFTIGRNFTHVDKATFTLTHRQHENWKFSFAALKKIGHSLMSITVIKEGGKYVFRGEIKELSGLEITRYFNANGAVSDMIERISCLKFNIHNVVLDGEFAQKLRIKIVGKALFLDYDSDFEGYIIDIGKSQNAVAFGITSKNVAMNNFAQRILGRNGRPIQVLDASWISNVTTTVVMADKAAIDEVVFSTPSLKQNEYLGEYNPTPEQDASFVIKVVIPDDCEGETMCEVLKKKMCPGHELVFSGEIQPSGFELMTLIKGDIEIADKFVLERNNLVLMVDTDAEEFSLNGEMNLKLNKNEVKFKAQLSVSDNADVLLTLGTDENWQKPFGIHYLNFGDFEMKVGFNEDVIQPRLSLGGDIAIGFGPNPFLSKLSGNVEISNDTGYFYTEIDTFSFEAVYLAFNIKHDLLEVLRDSTFPNGMVGGFSFPKAKRISSLGVNLNPSFTLKGKAVILGHKLFCKVQVAEESNLHVSGKFKKLEIANGLILLTSKDRTSGPLLNIHINASTVEFKIKGYVKVLKMGAATDITVADSGIRFNIMGMLLGLFTANVSFTAPYGELSKLSDSDFKVHTCIDDETIKEIQQVAIKEINESVVISEHAKEENTKRYENAENWLRKGLIKVEKWRNQMADREIKLDNKLKELDDFKKKLTTDCVVECSKKKISVGGIGLKTCIIGKQKIKCPYWIEKKKTRDDPLCLAKCEVKSVFKRKKWNTLIRKSDLESLQADIKKFSKLGKKAQSFFEATQSLVDRAKETSTIVGDVGRAGIKASKAIDKYTIKNIIQIDNLCMATTLAKAKSGCFLIDLTVYIGARNLKKVLSDDVEACLNKNFADELGQIIAYQAFPRLAPVKKKYERIKELLDDIDDESQTILSKSKELDAEEKKLQSRSLQDDDTAECQIVDYDRDLPEFVLRDDRTMQAFRDIFITDDDDDDNESGSDLNEASVKTANIKGSGTNNNAHKEEAASADTSPPASRDELEKCKQMHDIVDVYKEISNSASILLAENKYLKGSYEAFIKENLLKFDMLEGSTVKEARSLNLTEEEQNDALFYIRKGKEGIANWKANFDEKYEKVDKLTLYLWRQFIAKVLSKKRKGVEKLFELLRSGPSSIIRRYEISHPLKESMKHAHRVANHLFEEAGSISSMSNHIYELADHVHYMLQLKKEMKC